MHTIICSKKDKAGLTLYNSFLENYSFKKTGKEFDSNMVYSYKEFELYLINQAPIYADYVENTDSDFLIFATKHRGKFPALTTHSIGNFSKAEFGGKDFTLYKTLPFLMKSYLNSINSLLEQSSLSYEASLEATHHGPHISKPSLFIELGSNEEGWQNKEAAKILTDTVINNTKPSGKRIAIGIGDLHYPRDFNKLELNSDIAFSHILPKHHLENLNQDILNKMISATEKPDLIVVNWKSIPSEFKEKVSDLLSSQSIPWEKSHSLLKEQEN